MSKGLLASLAALTALALAIWIFDPFTSDEDAILKTLKSLEQNYYLDKGENKIQAAKRSKTVSKLFSEDIRVELKIKYRKPPKITNRKELRQAMLLMGSQLNNFNIDFYDIEVEFDPGNSDRATALTSCNISYQEDGSYEATDLVFEFKKVSGDWLIEKISNETPLEF